MRKSTGTRRTASGVAESKSRPYLTGKSRSGSAGARQKYVLCLRNDGFELALVPRKVYVALPDTKGAKFNMLRVIDESGEDYLFPKEYFAPIRLERAAQAAMNSSQ
jgi:hypothetical protein